MVLNQGKQKQRVFTLVSGAFFLASMVAGMIPVFQGAIAPQEASPVVASETDTLKAQAQGYELVLQREPNNQVALEGLANIRVEMNDLQGAIAPLETLVKLYPDRTDYQALLAEIRQKAATGANNPE